jgi:peptide/nickel transport system permease protein
VIRRALAKLVWAAFALWAVVSITFALNEVVPGDPARLVAGPQARPAEIAHVRETLGLERPVLTRYALFLGRLVHTGPPAPSATDAAHATCAAIGPLHVDLGRSYALHRPVVSVLGDRLPRSAALAGAAVVVQTVLGLVLGTFAAAKRKTAWDSATSTAALIGASVPTFLVGLALQYVLAQRLRWLPLDGFGPTTADRARALVLPALSLGLFGAAYATRFVRDEVTLALRLDHARTARAKGASRVRVLVRHALRLALAPLVTIAALDLGALVGGAIVVESLFRWPGLGLVSVTALLDRDGPMIMGTVLVTSASVIAMNLLADLALPWLDPRVRRDR